MAFSGKYRSPVSEDGLPLFVRQFCWVHFEREVERLGPSKEPPAFLYNETANCALRALHSPGSPPFEPDFTLETMRFHSAGFFLVAVLSMAGLESFTSLWAIVVTHFLVTKSYDSGPSVYDDSNNALLRRMRGSLLRLTEAWKTIPLKEVCVICHKGKDSKLPIVFSPRPKHERLP